MKRSPKTSTAPFDIFRRFSSLVTIAFAFLPLTCGCARRFAARGMILSLDPASHTVVVSHRDIPRYMPAMAMPFRVHTPADLTDLYPGAQVEFRLVAGKSGSYIRNLRRVGGSQVIEDQGDRITLPPNPDKIPVGALMPDFKLIDQQSRPVRLSDFRGKVVAVDFIYTRCPLPDVCPRLSANFSSLQRRYAARMNKDLALLSITIDPQYDTPPVLQRYGKIWHTREGWRLLTGPDAEIETVARRFGMNYWPEDGLVTHTSETGVIARNGALAARVDGSSFTPAQLGDLIQRELEKNDAP